MSILFHTLCQPPVRSVADRQAQSLFVAAALAIAMLFLWSGEASAQFQVEGGISEDLISIRAMLLSAVPLALIAGYMNWRYPLAFLITLLITGVLAATGVLALVDKNTGPMLLEEQGARYAWAAWGSLAFVAAANLAGLVFGLRRRKSDKAAPGMATMGQTVSGSNPQDKTDPSSGHTG